MAGREFSAEFIAMQKRSKVGKDNPQYGVKKSMQKARIKKLIKLVYVYNNEDMSYIGCYSTVQCSKEFKMGKPCTTCTYCTAPGQHEYIVLGSGTILYQSIY